MLGKRIVSGLLGSILLMLPGSPVSAQQTESKGKLEQVQQQLKHRKQQLQNNLASAKTLQNQLKQQELAIGQSAKALKHTAAQLDDTEQQLTKLASQQKSLKKQQHQQQVVLAKQLRSAYMAGNHDYAKMLFNLHSASKFERMLTYYQYLNNERQQQIDSFRQLSEQLVGVEKQLTQHQQQLLDLQQQQKQQQQQLQQQQDQRQQTLIALNRKIDTQAAQVEQLEINEQSMLQALQEAQQRAERQTHQGPVKLVGLGPFKGKLAPPVHGHMRRLFGNRRQGQVRWKGVLIYAKAGQDVTAVEDAHVLYADWLKGFGLVIALDHGNGYMSLYGHNQALLKQVGDDVKKGETIALVGQSGGQTRPGLYFEIRHKGHPVNPSKWLAK